MSLAALLGFCSGASAVLGVASALPERGRRPRPGLSRALRLALALGRLLRPARRLAPSPGLAARAAAAGLPRSVGAQELMGAKAGAALAAGAAGAALAAALPGRLGLLPLAGAPVAGFLAPDRWLARRAAARERRARAELPAQLDLLRVAVEAGVPLTDAFATVGERSGGLVAREWRAAAAEARLGQPLQRALAGTVRRLPLPELAAVSDAVERSLRHGAPLAEALAAQAREARAARARAIREESARAAPKIQLVVALLLVPSVLLLVAAALVAALAGSGAAAGL